MALTFIVIALLIIYSVYDCWHSEHQYEEWLKKFNKFLENKDYSKLPKSWIDNVTGTEKVNINVNQVTKVYCNDCDYTHTRGYGWSDFSFYFPKVWIFYNDKQPNFINCSSLEEAQLLVDNLLEKFKIAKINKEDFVTITINQKNKFNLFEVMDKVKDL